MNEFYFVKDFSKYKFDTYDTLPKFNTYQYTLELKCPNKNHYKIYIETVDSVEKTYSCVIGSSSKKRCLCGLCGLWLEIVSVRKKVVSGL
jgi:hypothetical protein